MSVTFLRDFERDPAAYIRKQLVALSEQNAREAAAAAKAKREDELLRGYAARHDPNKPEAA